MQHYVLIVYIIAFIGELQQIKATGDISSFATFIHQQA